MLLTNLNASVLIVNGNIFVLLHVQHEAKAKFCTCYKCRIKIHISHFAKDINITKFVFFQIYSLDPQFRRSHNPQSALCAYLSWERTATLISKQIKITLFFTNFTNVVGYFSYECLKL